MRNAHLLVGLVLVALGCGSESTSPNPTVATIALTPASIDTLFSVGETAQLSASARDASGAPVSGATVAFQSSAQNVATVTADGLVTAVGNGSATITASSGTVSATLTARVRQKLARVVLTPPSGAVVVGRTLSLSAAAQDLRGNPIPGLPAASFSSDNTGVARVDGSGVVTGVAAGSANVTASVTSAADGTRSATAGITVTNAPPLTATVQMLAVTFSPTSIEVGVGGTVTWVNNSGVPHDVDFGSPAMRIPVFETGQRSLTFANAGSFAYHCNLHAGMTGTVVVR